MKTFFYIVFGFIILGLLSGCKSANLSSKTPFNIIEKSYYNWTGGQPGVKGTNVVLKLMNTSKTFKADSLYFGGKGTLIETHIKKDTLVLMAYFSTPRIPVRLEVEPSQKNAKKKTAVKIPYKLKANEAILTYFINGVKKHFKITEIIETAKKYYP